MINRLLPILVIAVFFVLGSLWFFSGEEEAVSTAPPKAASASSSKQGDNEPPPLTDADRDTYVNTIKTMSARNNELLGRMEALEKRLQEKDTLEAARQRDLESKLNQSVEERADNLTATFSDKFEQLRSEIGSRARLPGGKGKSTGIPDGLGFDDFKKFTSPGSATVTPTARSPLGDSVTIMPLTTIATAETGNGIVPVSIVGEPLGATRERAVPGRPKPARPEKPTLPYFTIPQNATLFRNDTLTALVGIVPNLQGSVVDPIRFKVITGNVNMATNRKFLPAGVRDIVWSGIAIGNREMSCVRGEVHSVTFTFEDGTIHTVNAQATSGKNVLGGKMLGYIATPRGNPCLPGTLITNAQDYLMDRMLASGAAALASGFADTQKKTTQYSDGSTSSYFDGDEGRYVAGQTLAGSLSELTAYLRERQRGAVDLVYLDAGQDVVVHVESQIEIDYNPEGRKLDHASDRSKLAGYRLD